MPSNSRPPTRRRGRPVNADGEETASACSTPPPPTCAETGFDGATMSEIARRAGVTPAAIYNYYESREDLLYAAGAPRPRARDRGGARRRRGGRRPAHRHGLPPARARPDPPAAGRAAPRQQPRPEARPRCWPRGTSAWADALRGVLPAGDPRPRGHGEGAVPAAARPVPPRRPVGGGGRSPGGSPGGSRTWSTSSCRRASGDRTGGGAPMVMSTARIDAVKRQAVDEAARRRAPGRLPGAPRRARRPLRRPRVRRRSSATRCSGTRG